MAKSNDLMGLGMNPFQARALGDDPTAITCAGGSSGSATNIGGKSAIVYINASNSGSGVNLPQIGGDNGSYLGDDLLVQNLLSATIQVYAANNAAGSAVTIFMDGGAILGLTGVSVSTGRPVVFTPITVSTWVGLRSL